MRVAAVAHSNIALVKYWGKRRAVDPGLNLPAVGSLSITLDALSTTTVVEVDGSLAADHVAFVDSAGAPVLAPPGGAQRVARFLDLVRARGSRLGFARVATSNDFPTGAGLASSASGFAALALAATRAYGLELDASSLSRLARRGSGSAARSIFGGFVEMRPGTASDGDDAYALSLHAKEHWPLSVVVVVTAAGAKELGSTEAMTRTAATSPYWAAWCATHANDVDEARTAVAARDFERLAQVAERSSLKMHALMMASDPAVIYWNAATLTLVQEARRWRKAGVPVLATVDAGPQVKLVCPADAAAEVARRAAEVSGVSSLRSSGLGDGARFLDAPPAWALS